MSVTSFATPGAWTYTVPAGATHIWVECWGAQGGSFGGAGGGKGGYSQGKLVVPVGTVLWVFVGGTTPDNAAGPNGGGAGKADAFNSSSGGGGGSDVRLGGQGMANRVIVAGGGGGDGSRGGPGVDNSGGAGGGSKGVNGNFFGQGAGATQTTGYAFGQGGAGGQGTFNGGGGGGGFFGGIGGLGNTTNGGGGGGGGSGYLSTALASGAMLNGSRVGNGLVKITSVNAAPLAPTVTVPNNKYLIASAVNTLTWRFNDLDPGDSQSRADLRYKLVGAGTWTTVANAATTAGTYSLPANTWPVGAYEWQIATWDANGAAGPWSASQFNTTIAAVPAPTITSPAADGSNIFATPMSVSWTLTTGWTQDGYRVRRTSGIDGSGTQYYDSGVVDSTAQSALVPLDVVSGRTDYITITYRYFGNWSLLRAVSVVGQIAPPMMPVVFLVQTPNKPQVEVTIVNPPGSQGSADTIVTDLYRTGPDGSTVRIAANLPNGSTVLDLLPTGGVSEYLAVAYAANGASTISATTNAGAFADVFADVFA